VTARRFPDQPGGPLVDVGTFNATAAGSAGGMVSTTADLTRFWRALQGGRLLPPAQYAAMHRTVLAETYQEVLPGLRYGLGIFWAPDDCGGFWAHPGDVPGTSTYSAASADGNRTVGRAEAVRPGRVRTDQPGALPIGTVST
jgi:D-alanyl-D-alanine carboxypeptidase